MNRWAAVIIVLFLYNQGYAQLNLKIGYALGIAKPDVNNSILAEANATISETVDLQFPYEGLGTMHGISLGARYTVSNVSLEIGWENLGRTRIAVGENSNGSLFQEELFYRFNTILATMSYRMGSRSIGGSIGRNSAAIKKRLGNSSRKSVNFIPEAQFIARAHIGFAFGGNDLVSFEIRPYYQFPIDKINLNPLRRQLDLQEGDFNESFPMIGLTFVFYNGRQD